MTCACESVHKFPCQFPAETELFPITRDDDKKWCRFHLPLQDGNGNQSDKGRGKNGWEEGGPERQKFTTEIYARLRAAKSWDDVRINDTRANLNGVAFPPNFFFSHIANVTYVTFNGTTFGDGADFTKTTFGHNAEFQGARFLGTAYFTRVKFGNYALLNGAEFDGRTRFADATFGNWASFVGAKFGDWTDFTRATFGDENHFDRAIFSGEINYKSTTFGDKASFAKAHFRGSANFSVGNVDASKKTTCDFRGIDFSGTEFYRPCDFENRTFATSSNFNGAKFHDLVEFHGCAFHPGMSFHQTKFLKTKEDKLHTKKDNDDATERLERSYRTLKLEMEKLRARNEEADFFALEMECRRQRGSVPWFERLAASAYKHLSDYGRAVDLPLIWLLILAYAAHYLYLGVALTSCNPGAGARLAFTLEQMFRPFYVWAKSPPGTGNCLVENFPPLIPILASLQSLSTITLLTLFLLALRRRFKMD